MGRACAVAGGQLMGARQARTLPTASAWKAAMIERRCCSRSAESGGGCAEPAPASRSRLHSAVSSCGTSLARCDRTEGEGPTHPDPRRQLRVHGVPLRVPERERCVKVPGPRPFTSARAALSFWTWDVRSATRELAAFRLS
jgi:hypothetical protein